MHTRLGGLCADLAQYEGVARLLRANSGLSAGLQWKPMPGRADPTPEIKMFNAVEADGGTRYVSDEDTGTQQIGGVFSLPFR